MANLSQKNITAGLELYNWDGSLLATSDVSLPAGGHLARFVDEFDWNGRVDFAAFEGLLTVSAEAQLAATVIQTRPGEFATMPVVPRLSDATAPSESAVGSYELFFAHFGDGEGLLYSQIFLINPNGAEEAQAILRLRDDAGSPLSVDLNGQWVEGQLSVTVPAGGLRLLESDGQGRLAVGSVSVSSNQPLAGVVLFGGSTGVAGVGGSEVLETGFLAPVETIRLSGKFIVRTGVAVMNLEEEPVTLKLKLRGENGDPIDLAEANVVGKGHLARFVDEFDWPTDVVFDNFRGVLEVQADGKSAATVLQTRLGQFATMPVVRLK